MRLLYDFFKRTTTGILSSTFIRYIVRHDCYYYYISIPWNVLQRTLINLDIVRVFITFPRPPLPGSVTRLLDYRADLPCNYDERNES